MAIITGPSATVIAKLLDLNGKCYYLADSRYDSVLHQNDSYVVFVIVKRCYKQ
jgi:hypothetical protein